MNAVFTSRFYGCMWNSINGAVVSGLGAVAVERSSFLPRRPAPRAIRTSVVYVWAILSSKKSRRRSCRRATIEISAFSDLVDVLVNVVSSAASPGLLWHHGQALWHRGFRFQPLLGVFGRAVAAGYRIAHLGVHEGGLRVVGLTNGR